MIKHSKIDVAFLMKKSGIVPVFYNSNKKVYFKVIEACYKGGIKAIEFTNRAPVVKINYCDFFNTAKIIQNKSLCEIDNIFEVDPQFILGELYINEMSKLKNRGSDGKDIGALSH